MQITLSSMFITLAVCSILILLFYLVITNKLNSKFFRIDFLTILIVLILLRLFIPIELRFTVTIPMPIIMNPISDFINFEVLHGVKILHILFFIWAFGIFMNLMMYIKRLVGLRRIERLIIESYKSINVAEIIDGYEGYNYPIYILSDITAPMVLGFHKIILLPNTPFSEKELNNIILHEIYHIKTHDIYLKQFIKIITVIYWWFPPIYLLQREIDLFLELRADSKVTKSLSHYESLDYAETLIAVQRKVSLENPSVKLFSTCLLSENKKVLSYRINYLMEGNFQKRTNKLVLIALLIVPILSNSIILEAAYYDAPIVEGTFGQNKFEYIIHHKDGSYSLVIDGESVEFNNIDDPAFSGIKIIEE